MTEGEAAGRVEDQTQLSVSLEAFLATNYPEQVADEQIAESFQNIIEAAIEKLGVFNPSPPGQGARVGCRNLILQVSILSGHWKRWGHSGW